MGIEIRKEDIFITFFALKLTFQLFLVVYGSMGCIFLINCHSSVNYIEFRFPFSFPVILFSSSIPAFSSHFSSFSYLIKAPHLQALHSHAQNTLFPRKNSYISLSVVHSVHSGD